MSHPLKLEACTQLVRLDMIFDKTSNQIYLSRNAYVY